MKAFQIEPGGVYLARFNGRTGHVRVIEMKKSTHSGPVIIRYSVESIITGRRMSFLGARRFRFNGYIKQCKEK